MTPMTSNVFDLIMVLFLAGIFINITSRNIKNDNVRRIIIYLIILITLLIGMVVFKGQFAKALSSTGIAAAVILFIFQDPILNLVAWIYLSQSKVYRVGDRIKLMDYKGDVVAITPLHTKIRQIGGDYLHSDHYSGNFVTFRNSLVFSGQLVNYNRHMPYMFCDLVFQLSYLSDIEWGIKQMRTLTKKHIKSYLSDFDKKQKKLNRKFNFKTGLSESITLFAQPRDGLIDLKITFPVRPHELAQIKTKITIDVIKTFRKFPKKTHMAIALEVNGKLKAY